MAVFLDIKDTCQKKKRCEKLRKHYFQRLNCEIMSILQRIVWLDARLDDEQFDWSQPVNHYTSKCFVVHHSSGGYITYNEATILIEKCAEKYTDHAYASSTEADEKKAKIEKMFQIIVESSEFLFASLSEIHQERTFLDSAEYLTLEENKSIQSTAGKAIEMFRRGRGDLGTAIDLLRRSADMVRRIGNYNDNFRLAYT